jgi:hypothetical protein
MKDWEIIADNLSKADWGCISAIDSNARTIWIAAHSSDGSRTGTTVMPSTIGQQRHA